MRVLIVPCLLWWFQWLPVTAEAAEIAGRVTSSADGGPVADVIVQATALDCPTDTCPERFEASTAADGSYRLAVDPDRDYRVRTRHAQDFGLVNVAFPGIPCPGSCGDSRLPIDGEVPVGDDVMVGSGGISGIDFVLPLGGSITGVVTADPGPVPRGGIILRAEIERNTFVETISDADGTYRFDGLPEGAWLVGTDGSDQFGLVDQFHDGVQCGRACYPRLNDLFAAQATRVSVTPGGVVSGIDFRLLLEATLEVTVTSKADGMPLSGIGVRALRDGNQSIGLGSSLFLPNTDAAGRVQLSPLIPGTYRVATSGGLARGFVDEAFGDRACFANREPAPLFVSCPAGDPVIVGSGDTVSIDLGLAPFDQVEELVAVAGGLRGEGGPAATTVFQDARDLLVTEDGIHIADASVLLRIGADGRVDRLAGSGIRRTRAGRMGNQIDGASALAADLFAPTGLASLAGRIHFIDEERVYEIDDGVLRLQGAFGCASEDGGVFIEDDSAISSIAFLPDGQLLALDPVCQALAGSALSFFGQLPMSNSAQALTVEDATHVLFADTGAHRVVRVDLEAGSTETVAGTGVAGFSGDRGAAANARLASPVDLALDADGNIYVADRGNARIRMISATDGTIRTVAGSGDTTAGLSPDQRGDGGTAVAAVLADLRAVDVDVDGSLLILADDRLRRVDSDLARITTIAGDGPDTETAICTGGPTTLLGEPDGVAVDADDNVYFSEADSHVIRRFSTVSGLVETVAGTGVSGFAGDGGPARDAQLFEPRDLAHAAGILYVADRGNARIRAIDLASGTISTVAGKGVRGNAGDDGPAIAAEIDPGGIAAASSHTLAFSNGNDGWRIVDLADGTIRELLPIELFDPFSGSGSVPFPPPNPRPRDLAFRADGTIVLATTEGIAFLEPFSTPSGYRFSDIPFRRLAVSGSGQIFASTFPLVRTGFDAFFNADRPAQLLRFDENGGDARILAGTGRELGSGVASAEAYILSAGLAVDSRGDLLVADPGGGRVVRITTGQISLPELDELGEGARIGTATAASAEFLAIGSPAAQNPNGSQGAVAIYRRDGCRFDLDALIRSPDGFSATNFGRAVALDGTTLVVGAGGATETKGSTRDLQAAIFERSQQGWMFGKELFPGSGEESGDFGSSVAIEGATVIVGAPEFEGVGAVFVFDDTGGKAETVLRGSVPAGRFGTALSFSKGLLGVGAPGSPVGEATRGSVALFERVAGNLGRTGEVTSSTSGDGFGSSLALDGQRLLVGAPAAGDAGPDSGVVFAYDFDDLVAGPITVLRALDAAAGARFGASVALDRTFAYVGAPGARTAREGSGAVYGFSLDPASAKGESDQLVKVDASSFQRALGKAISLSEGRVFAGAPDTNNGRGDALALTVALNLSGLAGLWFDPAQEGEGYNVITAEPGTLVYYFGYDAAGERLWLVSDLIEGALAFGEERQILMLRANSGRFTEPVPSAESLESWGELGVRFDTARAARFRLDGRDGEKVSRATKLVGVFGTGGEYGGLWFDPALEGEGFNVIASEAGAIIYYYGSDRTGARLWLVTDVFLGEFEPGTAVRLPVFEARGGVFDAPLPSAESLRPWGELTVEFTSCATGVFQLVGSDGAKTSRVVKLAGLRDVACVD